MPDERGSRAAGIGVEIEWVSRCSFRWVGIALGAARLGLIVKFAWSIILPVALALVITSVLAPLAGFFERRLRFPAALSAAAERRSEEHTSELQSLMRISYAVFCLQKKNILLLFFQSLR